jgi:chaperonin GroES
MKMRPLHDRVMLQRPEAPEKTEAGLFIPDKAKERPNMALAVSVGPAVKDVKSGDTVLISKYAGSDVTVNGETLLIVKEEEIIAIIEK